MVERKGEAPRREVVNIAELKREIEASVEPVAPTEPTVPREMEQAVPRRLKDTIDKERIHDLAELRRLAAEAVALAEDKGNT
jgi:hypothetical protein